VRATRDPGVVKETVVMPDVKTIQAGVRKGIQKLVDREGSLKAAADKCGLSEGILDRIMTTEDPWGIGISERIAKALGIRLDQLTTGDFKTHAEEDAARPGKPRRP
jgi:hypothetical protein